MPSFPLGGAPSNSIVFSNGAVATVVTDETGYAISEKQTLDGPEATVVYQCLWTDRYKVVQALAGTTVSIGIAFIRTIPHQYPLSPNLYCVEIGDIRWIKARWSGTFASAELAQVPAVYRLPKWQFAGGDPAGQNDPSGQAWTTTKFKFSSEILTVPNGTYFWPSSITVNGVAKSGLPVPESSLGIPRPRAEINMTRKWCGAIDLSGFMGAIGKSNAHVVTFSNYSFVAGTLLLAGISTSPSGDSAGNYVQDIEYLMLGNGLGVDWNAVLAPDGAYHLINTNPAGGGAVPFPYADWFSTLP